MAHTNERSLPTVVTELMAKKTEVLSKAHGLTQLGMAETAQPLWTAAAGYEERIAPLLESLGREEEAAVHRISAASSYQQAGDWTRAANHYRAALSGPLNAQTQAEVEGLLKECLHRLKPTGSRTTRSKLTKRASVA